MGRNAGFAAAVNRGIREARGEWLAILNSDVELAPDYLEKLAAPDAPFATGRILSPHGTLDATFDLTSRAGTTWRAGAGMADTAPFDRACDIASPPFTAVLVRADVFERAGLLEERFESYLEDAEFGLRCARLGIQGRYVPEARAVHAGSATLGRWHPETVRRIARNQLFLAARHLPRAVVVGGAGGPVALGRCRIPPRQGTRLDARQVARSPRIRAHPDVPGPTGTSTKSQ